MKGLLSCQSERRKRGWARALWKRRAAQQKVTAGEHPTHIPDSRQADSRPSYRESGRHAV